jgi:hypothetical protein
MLLLVWHWRLVCHVRLLLLVCVLTGACGLDFRTAFIDDGLVFRVGGWVSAIERVVECSAEGFSCAVNTCCCCFKVCHCTLLVQVVTGSVWDWTIWVIVVGVGVDARL